MNIEYKFNKEVTVSEMIPNHKYYIGKCKKIIFLCFIEDDDKKAICISDPRHPSVNTIGYIVYETNERDKFTSIEAKKKIKFSDVKINEYFVDDDIVYQRISKETALSLSGKDPIAFMCNDLVYPATLNVEVIY